MSPEPGPVRLPAALPRVRRKIPAPYQRPTITTTAPPARRAWRDIPVVELVPGDLVPGIGVLHLVAESLHTDGDHQWTVTVRGGADNHHVYAGNDRVLAFVADRS